MTDSRTLFNIPVENYEKFSAQIKKISNKSVKLGFEPIEPLVFSNEEVEMSDGKKHRVYNILLTAEIPRIEGWTFIARLDHSNETGTIVRAVPNQTVPEQYRSALSTTCEHCNVKRYRRDTFVVRNDETGEHKQVGSACLGLFFEGHDPYKVAKLAELLGYARECGHAAEHFVGGDLRWISLEDFLGHAAAVVRKHGWVSGKAAYEDPRLVSTRQRTWEEFSHPIIAVTDADRALVTDALAWASAMRQKETMSEYEHNISVIADATMIEPRSAGLAVSIVGVFYNNRLRSQQHSKTADVGDMKGVVDLLKTGSTKLQFPKIRLALDNGQPIVLSLAGAKSASPGWVNVTDGGAFGDNVWYGKINPQGTWNKSKAAYGATEASLVALLTALAADPAATMAAYGKKTGQCGFCNKALDDARSVSVGYGKVCASKYNLFYPTMKEVRKAA